MNTHNNLLVIIVTYNAMQWVKQCIHSLQTSTIVPDVFIVDNGSTDGTQDYLKTNHPSFIFMQNETNLGFGKANNLGLQYALDNNYDYVYLLNQDAWVMPDTFENLLEISKKNPKYGILSPMQMKADMEHLDGNFITNVICNHQRFEPFFIEDLFFNRKEDVYEVTFVMAAHWLITRKCIETVGGFSPSFYLYGEDDNYINRASFWKFKIGIVPKSIAVHDRSNPRWDDKKRKYIDYVHSIVAVSNPLDRLNIYKCFIHKMKQSILNKDTISFRYAIKLLSERNKISTNYHLSLTKKAFLL